MKEKQLKAYGKTIIVQLIEDDKSRIVIPETVSQATIGAKWIVRKVGPQCQCGVKVGDYLIIAAIQSATEFTFNGATYFVTREENIAAGIE